MKTSYLLFLFVAILLFPPNDVRAQDWVSEIDSLIAMGSLERADEKLVVALQEKETNALKSRQEYVKATLASAGDCQTVLPHLEAARALAGAYTSENHLYWTHLQYDYMNCLVQVRDMGRLIQERETVLQHLKGLPNTLMEACILYNVGLAYRIEDNYVEAVNYYQQAINFYEQHDPIPANELAEAYNNIGYAYSQLGIFNKQVEFLTKAYEIDADNEDTVHQHLLQSLAQLIFNYSYYGNREKTYFYLGELDRKIAEWTAADRLEDLQMPPLAYQFYSKWMHSFSASALQDKEQATLRLESFGAFMEQLPPQMEMPFTLYYLSAVMQYAGQESLFETQEEKEARLAAINRGLSLSRQVGDVFYEAGALYYMANYYREKKDFAKALYYLDQAIAIGEKSNLGLSVGDNRAVGEQHLLSYLVDKALLYSNREEWSKVPTQLDAAFSILLSDDFQSPDGVLLSLNEQTFEARVHTMYVIPLVRAAGLYAALYEKSENPEDARISLHLYKLAAKVFNQYYLKGEYNSRLSELNRKINEGIFKLHLGLDLPLESELANLLEDNTTQHLRKEFEKKQRQHLAIPDSLFARQQILQAEREYYTAAIPKDSLKAMEKINLIETALSEIESKIDAIDPAYFPFFRDTFDLTAVQNHLSDKQLVIKYVVGDQAVYALTISDSAISPVYLGEKDAVFEDVASFYQATRELSPDYSDTATSLYDLLIAPLGESLTGKEDLVIIPDDRLNYLPFEALQNPADHRLLVQDYTVSYSHTVHLWSLQQEQLPTASNQDFLAVFVPEYTPDYYGAVDTTALVFRDGNRLLDLKGAAVEARSIANMLKGTIFQSKEATKENFIDKTDNYRIYHLAMHALMNEEDYEKSHLVFQDEEPLYYSDLYSLNFPADLVVLSACNTGMGKLEEGEGIHGLSRALTYAGVRSSIYSLWQVPDEETAEIMVAFYSHLKDGKPKNEALTLAKRDFVAHNPMKTHPFFWAGFVLNGNADAVPVQSNNRLFLWLLGFLFVGGIGYWALRPRRKNVQR